MTSPIHSKTPTSPLSPLRRGRQDEAPTESALQESTVGADSNATLGRRYGFPLPEGWQIPGLDDYNFCPPPKPPAEPPGAVPADGSPDYYKKRHADFVRRHPDKEPPDYYLGYGDKYAQRFTNELRPMLSPEGRLWLDKARQNLQEAIEQKRREDPEGFAKLEQDPDAFREFAYETHAKAYLDAGLADLPLSDLVKIGLTPDFRDLFTEAGLSQVLDVVPDLVAAKLDELDELPQEILDLVDEENVDDFIDLVSRADNGLVLLKGLLAMANPGMAVGAWLADKVAEKIADAIEGLKEKVNAFKGLLLRLACD